MLRILQISNSLQISEAAAGRCFAKLMFLKKIYKIQRKTHLIEFLLSKVTGLQPATLHKKILWHMCFPVMEHLQVAVFEIRF